MGFRIMHTPIKVDRISQPFKAGKHKGIDLVDTRGTKAPIYAVADGVVIASGKGSLDWSYGNEVFIKHDDGFFTNYAHMSKRSVRQGAKVKAGQIIGYQGSTGRSTGNHLHFEVWDTDGKPRKFSMRVNPSPYLSALKNPLYEVGRTYTLVRDNMNLRDKANGKVVGSLKKGTKIVVLKVAYVNATCWLKVGDKRWVCGYSGSKVYIK